MKIPLLSSLILVALAYSAQAQIIVSALDGNYDARTNTTAGWSAFDNSTLKPAEYTGTSNPNGQDYNATRDNTLTFQFGESMEIGQMLLGVYFSVGDTAGTLKVFEVADVNGDISGDLAGTPIFSETFATTATTFTALAGTTPVGTLAFDFSSALAVEDRSSVSATAGYAFQFDFDAGAGKFSVSTRTGIRPDEWSSYYRKDSPGYTSPVSTNGYMVGFTIIPEPSALSLLMGSLGMLMVFRRRRLT